MPDILVTDDLSMENYAARGLLSEIGEFIEKDDELSRTDFLQNVFDAYSTDGKLYYVIPCFSMGTMIGASSTVGERTSWTFADAMLLLETLPEGTNLLPEACRNSFLRTMMTYCGSSFIDTGTAKCNFESLNFLDDIICRSEYTMGLHTQIYWGNVEDEDAPEVTLIYCIDLEDMDGENLVGKELTVRLLYAQDGEGFVSTFTPTSCFTGRSWDIGRTYQFGEHKIILKEIRESALYVTLFIDCATIGHIGDDYAFILSDELGNDYTAYSNRDSDAEGYWFTKPETMGTQLTLKVIRSYRETDPHGVTVNDSYEVLYEIPIELKSSFWDNLFGRF